MEIRNRIVEVIQVPASSLRDCPWNWRTHEKEQKEALGALLKEVGYAGVLLVRKLDDGTYMLIDGHCRKEVMGKNKVWIAVTDLDEKEANLLLAAYDPISTMAGKDDEKLTKLLKNISTESKPLASLFSSLLKENGKKLKEDLELDVDEEEEKTSKRVKPPAPEEIPSSGVRMVNVFLNSETIVLFEKYIKTLSERFETGSLTETLLASLEYLYEKTVKSTKKEVEA